MLTPDGFKPIGSLRLGDMVTSYNTSLGKDETDMVIGQHVLLVTKEIVEVKYDGGCVRCTYDHEVWSAKRRAYLTTDRLLFSDTIRTDENWTTESNRLPRCPFEQMVFDITVKKNKNFMRAKARAVIRYWCNMAAETTGSSSSKGGSGSYKHEGEKPDFRSATYKDNHFSTGANSSLGLPARTPAGDVLCRQAHRAYPVR